MVPREFRAHCSIVRLAKRRKGFGEQSLADFAPPCRFLVEDGTEHFCKKKKVGPCRKTQRDRSSRAASDQRKMWTHGGVAMVPKKITPLILEITKYSEYSAARQFLCQKLRGTKLVPWTHHPECKLVTYKTKNLGDQWYMNLQCGRNNLPVRASGTRGPADGHATQITVVLVTERKMVITKQSTGALTVSSGMSR